MMTKRRDIASILLLIPVFYLAACSTVSERQAQRSPGEPSNSELFKDGVSKTGKSVPAALRAPFRDLNMMKRDIPPALLAIEYPYALSTPVYCDDLVKEVTALDDILGVSYDVSTPEKSTREMAAEAATDAATNALEDATTGWIPYRSVIRRMSGAHQHEREISKAYERGRIRRAFLKGVGGAFDCPYPARPSSIEGPMPIVRPDGPLKEREIDY